MSGKSVHITITQTEILGDALTLDDLARCARVSAEWIATHVEAGALQPERGAAARDWRFTSETLVRVRRLAQLERTYDADPQLAALTADLMEEVAQLRRRLHLLP